MSRWRLRVRGWSTTTDCLAQRASRPERSRAAMRAIPVRVPLLREVWAEMERRADAGPARWRRFVDTRAVTERLATRPSVACQPRGRRLTGARTPTRRPGHPCWRFHSPIARWSAAMRTLRLFWRSWAATMPALSSAGEAHQVEPVAGLVAGPVGSQAGGLGQEVPHADGNLPVALLPRGDGRRGRPHRQVVVDEEVERVVPALGDAGGVGGGDGLQHPCRVEPVARGVVDVEHDDVAIGVPGQQRPQGWDLRDRYGAALERDPGLGSGRRRRRSRPPRGGRG